MHGRLIAALSVAVLLATFSTFSSAQTTTIEAENYSDMSGVRTEATSDEGGGINVGWIDAGDWMSYDTALLAGEYRLSFRVAALEREGQFEIQADNGSVNVSNVGFGATGGWQNWTTVHADVFLDSGIESFRLYAAGGGWNLNWIKIESLSQSSSESSASSSASSPENAVVRVEAEDYLEIYGMQLEATDDVGGGENVGWTEADDWISYDIRLPAPGEYEVRFRVAGRGEALDRFVLESEDIEDLSHVVNFAGTGAWQSWTTVEEAVALPEGEFTLVVKALAGDWNINWLEFELVSESTSSSRSSSSSSSTSVGSSSSMSSSSSSEAPANYLVSTQTDGFGSMEPLELRVQEGTSALFVVTAQDGYIIDSVTGCGGVLSQDGYSVENLSSDCTIEATFQPRPGQPGDIIDERYKISETDSSIVVDLETGLEWRRCTNGSEWNGSECVGESEEYELVQAQSQNFEEGWRVPNREELEALVHCSSGLADEGIESKGCRTDSRSPTLNDKVFPGAQPKSLYWSSTPTVKLDDSYWTVNFFNGESRSLPHAEYDHLGEIEAYLNAYLRLVRGDGKSQYNLLLKKMGEGSGEILVDQEGTDCGEECQLALQAGGEIEVLAVPAPGSVFARWSGGCRSTDHVCMVDIDKDQEVHAHFLVDRYEFPGENVVVDNNTGLEWQRCSYGQEWTGVTCTGDAETDVWYDLTERVFPGGWRLPTNSELASVVYCDSGSPSFEGGQSSPCHNEYTSPTIATWAFPNTPKMNYWSSTTADNGWPVVRDFNNGKAGYISGFSSSAFRLVRDPEPPESVEINMSVTGSSAGEITVNGEDCVDSCVANFSNVNSIVVEATSDEGAEFYRWEGLCSGFDPRCEVTNWHEVEALEAIFIDDRYEVRGDERGIIYDSTTDLEWQRCSYGQEWDGESCIGDIVPLNSSEANAIASDMGWRIPAYNELRTLVFCSSGNPTYWGKHESSCLPTGRDEPTIAENYFPSTENVDYMSSTFEPSQGWGAAKNIAVDFRDGSYGVVYSGNEANVRFVRGGGDFPKKSISIRLSGGGDGRVFVNHESYETCDQEECEFLVSEGSTVTLSYHADSGSEFFSWGGLCSKSRDECTVLMDRDRDVEVFFNMRTPYLFSCPYNSVKSDFSYIEVNPEENIYWSVGEDVDVESIASAFNYARYIDPSVNTYLVMPEQNVWDQLSLQDKGLHLVNSERSARGLKPFSGVDASIQSSAKNYADYILTNNQVVGHYNDGQTPLQRMRTEDYVMTNSDSYIRKAESLAGVHNFEDPVSQEYALVRAIYAWLYEDKDWYRRFGLSEGDDWGHRKHLLQKGLQENNGDPFSEGVAGFGVATGLYQPGADSVSTHGAVTVFNTIDQGPTWDGDRLQVSDFSNSQGCYHHTLTFRSSSAKREFIPGLESISIVPSNVHLAVGQSAALSIIGHYGGGEVRDLTDTLSHRVTDSSVVSIANGEVIGRRSGYATVYVSDALGLDYIDSNRIQVTVGEALDVESLTGTRAGSVAPYLAENATLPTFVPAMEEQRVEADFDPYAMAVFTGTVQDRYGVPLSGVQISFLHARNYGSVTTDMDGRFIIAGPAGEQTVVYEKPGYLVLQRSGTGGSGQWSSLEEVTLLERDSKVTNINLSSGEPQVHQSSLVSDEFGDRQATVIFNGITSAVIRSADGSERPIEQFQFSATEFESPSSMPGELPRETAFTWASDLHVDGTHYTDSVHFDGDVVMFVDNFLNFDVGEIVPIGYFDRRISEWVASSNGVVVELLDSDSDGVVDGLDYTGDGQPDDLNGNGNTADEVIGLESYSARDTLWWGSFNHMTPLDYNWGAGDEEAPDEVDPELSEEDEHDEDCVATGSYAKPYQQSFHEDIDIAGSNLTLHYSSQRTQGYHHKIRVALSGDEMPVMPVRMIARLEIAGRVFEKSFDPQTGLEAEFVWDGTHPDGTIAEGLVSGRVSLGYEHGVKYLSAGNAASEQRPPSEFSVAWATEGESETQVPARENFIAWRQRGITIKNTYHSQLAEGWSLSSVHELGPVSEGTVYLGNGGVHTAATPSLILRTGQTASYVDGDDGYYQAGGKNIDYTITNDNVLQDRVTGLQWQNERTPFRTTTRLEAAQYCADLEVAGQTDWRLPTPKEAGYTIDKSTGDAVRRIHSLSRGRELWNASTINNDQRELAAICVRGTPLDERNIVSLDRNESDQVVIDKDNGLMWQDSADNASLTLGWLDSIDYCETSQHAGYDNWRLPNINELLYILPNPVFQYQTSLPEDIHWNYLAPERNPYWSSTTNITDEEQAWAIESIGFNSERFDKLDQYHVRCVREDSTAARSPYRFDGDDRHTATIDLNSGVELSTLEYDGAGRVIRIVDRFGSALTIDRNQDGAPSRIVAPNGEVTSLTVNQQGHLTGVQYEDDTGYQFSYKNGGLLTGKIDPNGHVYEREYDDSGRLLIAKDPMGGFWELFDERLDIGWDRFGYDTAEANRHEVERRVRANGDVEVTTTDKTGAMSVLVRSADELRETITAYGMTTVLDKVLDEKTQRPRTDTVTVTTPEGLISTTELDKQYRENGADTTHYTVTASQNGKSTLTEIDSRTGVTRITSPEGRVTAVYSDPDTLLIQRLETPGQYDREYEYDSRGRLIEERVGDRTTMYTYDDVAALGRLTRITTPDDRSTEFEYDLLGRVTQVIYPDGNSTVTEYDANGNATRVTVPTQAGHESTFNGVNKVETEDRPDTPPTAYTYNLEKQLTQIALPSGDTIDYIYENGLLIRTEAPEADARYHYQQGDQLARVERDEEKVHYAYDGTLLTELRHEGWVNATLGYSYNADFRVSNMSYAGAGTSIGYDDDGLLTEINGYELTYGAQSGFLEELKDGNLTQTWQWNGYGESTAVDYYQSGTNTYGYDLEYDPAGRIVRKIEQTPTGTAVYEYDYDDRGRLVEVIKEGVIVEAYAYDANGNRTLQTSTEVGVDAESAIYTAGDQLESRGTTTYTYDANGRLNGKVEEAQDGPALTTYLYGSQGQLLQVDTSDKSIEYRHNALGQRVAKLIDGEVVERYLWQDLTTLLAVYDGQNNLKQRFEYTVGHTPTSFTQGGQRYYIQTDHLGSPRVITDSSGSVVKAIRYDSYGNITDDSNPEFEIPFGFAGGLHDMDAGLIRFGYRDYDPYTGRWTARDPIGFKGGDTNLYGYVINNPISYIDIFGLSPLDPSGKNGLPGGTIGDRAGLKPPSLVEKATNFGLKQGLKKMVDSIVPGAGKLVASSPLGVLFGGAFYSTKMGCGALDCNNDGVNDYTGEHLYLGSDSFDQGYCAVQ